MSRSTSQILQADEKAKAWSAIALAVAIRSFATQALNRLEVEN
jgi:hypothetical protein